MDLTDKISDKQVVEWINGLLHNVVKGGPCYFCDTAQKYKNLISLSQTHEKHPQ
jgi:hypothetical protein